MSESAIQRNRDRARAWAKAHPEEAKARVRAWVKRNPKRRRDIILKNRYCCIREGQYDEMLAKQNGVCAICGKPAVGRSLEVDHDHNTEHIRGLLCHGCNVGIGFLKDDVELLQKAILYLEQSK